MSDRIFAVAWLMVCTLIMVQMSALQVPFAYEPVGPKAFPTILAILMAVCCLILLIRPDPEIHWPDAPILVKGSLVLVVLLAYAGLFEWLGFPLATGLMVFGVNQLFGGRWWSGLISAAVVGIGGYFVFDYLLGVTLPMGKLGRLF